MGNHHRCPPHCAQRLGSSALGKQAVSRAIRPARRPYLIGIRLADTPTLMPNQDSLFDQVDRARFTEPGKSASRFERVNRSNKPYMHRVRKLWEGWYARFPDRSGGLRSRFRGDDHNHDCAVLELFLYELFTRLYLSVAVEPELEDGRSPDFLVSGADGQAYVEATYLKQRFTTPALEQPVLDAINELAEEVSPAIGLSVQVEGALKRAPSLRRIKRHAAAWLNQLNPQSVSWTKEFQTTIAVEAGCGDWRLILTAIPRGLSGGLIVIGPTRSGSFNVHEDLRMAVNRKTHRYRNLGSPLVVAADIPSFDADRVEEEALFGSVGVRLRADPSGEGWTTREQTRSGKALWFDNEQRRNRNAELTALMMVHDLAPWTVANVSACLYLNPNVEDQVPRELKSFGYAAAIDGELHRHEGSRTIRELMGLPQDWPGIHSRTHEEQI